MVSRTFATTWLAALVFFASAMPGAVAKELTLATLAPEKSAWYKVFAGWANEIEEKSGGALKLKIYAGGVQGDEEVVVQKMRTGQIHGAAITSIGLGKISPNVLVLQVPMLFDSWKELDYVRKKMSSTFESEFAREGFELIGWGDVGFVHVFSNAPVRMPSDSSKVKMWAWSSDPVASTFMSEAGGSPIPLSVPDVMPGLENGTINAFYNSPLAAIALRWFTKVKYMNSQPIGVGVGATVFSKKAWDSLTPEEQTIVRDASKKWHKILKKKVRKDNRKSLKLLAKKNMTVVELTDAENQAWKDVARRAEKKLTGRVFDKSIIDKVREHLTAYRAK